uniref:Uncharacterized protein n=1 Tax=Panagrolaimus sp. JU765 TaxID=591449 RepID=A0AC34RNY9_9BILA
MPKSTKNCKNGEQKEKTVEDSPKTEKSDEESDNGGEYKVIVDENEERMVAGIDKIAISPLVGNEKTDETKVVTLKEANEAFREFSKWNDLTDDKGLFLAAKHALCYARYGTTIRNLNKIVGDKSENSIYLGIERAIVDLVEQLGWIHLSNNLKNVLLDLLYFDALKFMLLNKL